MFRCCGPRGICGRTCAVQRGGARVRAFCPLCSSFPLRVVWVWRASKRLMSCTKASRRSWRSRLTEAFTDFLIGATFLPSALIGTPPTVMTSVCAKTMSRNGREGERKRKDLRTAHAQATKLARHDNCAKPGCCQYAAAQATRIWRCTSRFWVLNLELCSASLLLQTWLLSIKTAVTLWCDIQA